MEISELVNQTIASGLPPLELKYKGIRSFEDSKISAYRTEIFVNSIELGPIMQSEFSCVSDKYDVGIRISEWGIINALKQRKVLLEAEKNIKWISVACPAAFAELPDFYERIKSLLKKYKYGKDIKLCLEFSDQLLLSKSDVKKAILDLKLLDVHSLLVCDNSDTCPFFKLVNIPVDYILLTHGMTKLIDDRNKPEVLSSLIRYFNNLDVQVIADGVETGSQIRELGRLDCEGYVLKTEEKITIEDVIVREDV